MGVCACDYVYVGKKKVYKDLLMLTVVVSGDVINNFPLFGHFLYQL